MNVQMRIYILRTLITHPLIHIHQKKKITIEVKSQATLASVNTIGVIE